MAIRILLAAGRESAYPRNRVLLQALRASSHVTAITPTGSGSLSFDLLGVLLRLIPVLRKEHDLVVLGFYSHPLVPVVRRLTSKPILFDAFVSTWDTLSFDRARFSPRSMRGRLTHWLDNTACRLADHVLLDTYTHARYFIESFDLPPDKVAHWYVGCDESIFRPAPPRRRSITDPFRVLFYGTYQPLHGVDIIVQAAALLQDDPRICFTLIGDGQTSHQVRLLVRDRQLANIELGVPVPLADLPRLIAESDLCLAGPFGSTPKAGRVITGKTSQILAVGRPAIAGDSPANRELLVHGASAYLCRRADPHALAEAIRQLASDPDWCATLAAGGRRLFEERLSQARLTADLAPIIDRTLHSNALSAASNRSTHTSH